MMVVGELSAWGAHKSTDSFDVEIDVAESSRNSFGKARRYLSMPLH